MYYPYGVSTVRFAGASQKPNKRHCEWQLQAEAGVVLPGAWCLQRHRRQLESNRRTIKGRISLCDLSPRREQPPFPAQVSQDFETPPQPGVTCLPGFLKHGAQPVRTKTLAQSI
ncbi:hypothetical protein Y1Q_0000936 [Alligator mississippiensis]|uniref:Uncharacterized protein n=1 Tax=Alligator mississippiensis TaxID=8496 RepID=A0A151NE06_ALLMI|nr:hypothetical protein Y1Q_0000936 [Alligator mississippiensis]